MKRLNQIGFSAVMGLLLILVLACMGGAGYYVIQKNEKKPAPQSSQENVITNFDECVAAGNSVTKSLPAQCHANGQTFRETINNKFTLDKSAIPVGWNTNFNEADVISMDNSAIDRKPSENCFVEAKKTNDQNVNAANAEKERKRLYDTKKAVALEAKGYKYETAGNAQIKLNTKSGVVSIESYFDKVVGPEGSEITYQKNAYLINDGSYIEITQSCGGKIFTESEKAFSAIKFE